VGGVAWLGQCIACSAVKVGEGRSSSGRSRLGELGGSGFRRRFWSRMSLGEKNRVGPIQREAVEVRPRSIGQKGARFLRRSFLCLRQEVEEG
jgi:hypothetical protein